MRVRNAKRIVIILLSVMLASSLVFGISISLNVGNQFKSTKIQSSALTITDSTTLSANYSNYSTFEINSLAGLQQLAEMCYHYGDASKSNERCFTGKTINITADIDCNGENLTFGLNLLSWHSGSTSVYPCFNGTFNGNNHTISNFNISEAAKTLASYSVSTYGAGVQSSGLFQVLGANGSIENLKLRDFRTSLNNRKTGNNSGSADSSYLVSGLVGYAENGATISNCSIENFQHVSNSETGTGYVNYGYLTGLSGIIAAGYGAISNCYVSNVYTTYTESMAIYGVGPATDVVWANTNSFREFSSSITKCICKGNSVSVLETSYSSSVKDYTSGLNYSNETGEEGTIWYYHTDYNGGYPYLRQFMSWTYYRFKVLNNYGGTVDEEKINFPKDYSPSFSLTNETIQILGKSTTASPNTGYKFVNWTKSGVGTYIAKFELLSYTVTFNNVSGTDSADVISPQSTGGTASNNGTITFILNYGSKIIPNISEANGPCKIIYTITNNDAAETKYTVTYSIPEKYNINDVPQQYTITDDTEINLNAVAKYFYIKFEKADNAYLKYADGTDINSSIGGSMRYGDSVTSSVDLNNSKLQFVFNDTTIEYVSNGMSTIEKVDITVGTNETTIEESNLSNLASILTSKLSNITDNITIQPYYVRWYNVTFKTIGNTTSPTADKTISVKSGTSISSSISTDKKTLTYTYNGESVTYKANQYYILNNTSTSLTNISSDLTIKPTAEFYACYVYTGAIGVKDEVKTVELFSGESKVKNKYVIYNTDNEIICYVNIEDDYYKTLNDGVFIVEYGTTVEFTVTPLGDGKFYYSYEFSSGQYIEYIITNDQYAMQYKLDDEGNREYIYNALNGKENSTYTIKVNEDRLYLQPTFGKKQYNVSLD